MLCYEEEITGVFAWQYGEVPGFVSFVVVKRLGRGKLTQAGGQPSVAQSSQELCSPCHSSSICQRNTSAKDIRSILIWLKVTALPPNTQTLWG